MRTKSSRTHLRVRGPRTGTQIIEQHACLRRRQRPGKPGTCARARIGRQRELGNKEESAAGLANRSVHPSGLVRKHAVSQDAFQQPIRHGLVVTRLGADQRHDPAADFGDTLMVDVDACRCGTLQECNHGAENSASAAQNAV